MSIGKLTVRFLFLLGVLAALPACNPVPIVLMNFSGLPGDSARINIIVTQGTDVGKGVFQREDMTNKWLPMESTNRPPAPDCPSTATLALELPRGTDGAVSLKISVDPPQMGMMTNPPAMIMPIAGACVKFDVHDGALNEVAVPLMMMAPQQCP